MLNYYFYTILTYKFGINDKNHAPDNPTGPAPTINIDCFFILFLFYQLILNLNQKYLNSKNINVKLITKNYKNENVKMINYKNKD